MLTITASLRHEAITIGQNAALIAFNGQDCEYVRNYVYNALNFDQTVGVDKNMLSIVREGYRALKNRLDSATVEPSRFASLNSDDELVFVENPYDVVDTSPDWKFVIKHLSDALEPLFI